MLMTLAAVLAPQAWSAETAPSGSSPENRFEICLWPRRCGPGNKKPEVKPVEPAQPQKPKTENDVKPVPQMQLSTDPLTQAILKEQLSGDGIVSAVRVKDNQILYRGKSSLELPKSSIPSDKKDAKDAQEEWTKIDSEGAAARQVNSMGAERPALSSTMGESKEGTDRMWGDKEKTGSPRT